MVCGATAEKHCCWVRGVVCPYFDAAGLTDGRAGACTLRSELGSWVKVHTDPRYLQNVKANIPSFVANKALNCGDYPQRKTCPECGTAG